MCKVGVPVAHFKENLEKIKNRVKEKNLGIIIYDEIEDGRYKFKDKSYDVILELEGESISETRRNTNCNKCENNVYVKETNMYTIRKEDYEELAKKFENFLESIKQILNIK